MARIALCSFPLQLGRVVTLIEEEGVSNKWTRRPRHDYYHLVEMLLARSLSLHFTCASSTRALPPSCISVVSCLALLCCSPVVGEERKEGVVGREANEMRENVSRLVMY